MSQICNLFISIIPFFIALFIQIFFAYLIPSKFGIGTFVSLIFFSSWYIKANYDSRKIRNYTKPSIIFMNSIYIIIMGFGCQFVFTGIMNILQRYYINIFSTYRLNISTLYINNPILVLLIISIIAPISEEILFRGIILRRLQTKFSFYSSNIIQSFLFGMYHMNLIQGIYSFLLSLLFGYLQFKYKTVLSSILLHITINISSLLLYLFFPISLTKLITLGLILIILSLLSMQRKCT